MQRMVTQSAPVGPPGGRGECLAEMRIANSP
jgi:hypothetical protein